MIQPIGNFTIFIVKDLAAAKDFYTRHFGFTVAFENEWYLHLLTELGFQVGFMRPDQPTQPEMFHKAHDSDGIILSIEVENADVAYADAQVQNLDITLPLRSEEWGQRHFCIKDPNGIHLDIVQTIEATEEYQAGYTQ